MERFIADLVQGLDSGNIDRREFCKAVALAAAVYGAGDAAQAQAQRGFKIILSLIPSMHHQIGAATIHRVAWKSVGTSNHSPLRRYYMMRNQIALAQEYLFKDPAWVISSLYARLKSTMLMALFERDRGAKLRLTALGLWDGLIANFSRNISPGA